MEVRHQIFSLRNLWLLVLIENFAFAEQISRGGICEELQKNGAAEKVVPENSIVKIFRTKRSIVDWDRRAANSEHKVDYDLVISQLPISYRVQPPPILSSKKKQLNKFKLTRLKPSSWRKVLRFQSREKRSLESQSAESTLEIELQHAKARRKRQRHQIKKFKNANSFPASAEAVVIDENKNAEPDIHVTLEETTIHLKGDRNSTHLPNKWQSVLSSLGLSINDTSVNATASTSAATPTNVTTTKPKPALNKSSINSVTEKNTPSKISATNGTFFTPTTLPNPESTATTTTIGTVSSSQKPVLDQFNMMCKALAGKIGNPELSNPIGIEVVKGPVAQRAVAEAEPYNILQQLRRRQRIRQTVANGEDPDNVKIEAFF